MPHIEDCIGHKEDMWLFKNTIIYAMDNRCQSEAIRFINGPDRLEAWIVASRRCHVYSVGKLLESQE